MDLQLRERTYVITGGSSGVGFATAEALVAEGARVVLSGRDKERVGAAADRLGPAARGLACDNADPTAPDLLAERALQEFGRLDGLLVSVGGPPSGAATAVTDEQWRASFDSVFLGAVRLATGIGGRLGQGGSVALVLSTSVRSPIPALGISNGLRPGLAMVAKSLATEWGPAGVRVNGLLPGWTATDRMRYVETTMSEEAREAALAAIPLRRACAPEEFGRTAAFVLSPAASYLTGAMIPVDGGVTPGL